MTFGNSKEITKLTFAKLCLCTFLETATTFIKPQNLCLVKQSLYYKMELKSSFLFICQICLIQAFNSSKTTCTEDELPCKYGSIDPCTGEPAGADYCFPKFQEGWDGFMCEYTTCPMNCPTPPPTPSVRGGGFKFCEVYDEHGCTKSPGSCINQYDEFPDYLCNSNCPTICKPNERECPGELSEVFVQIYLTK